MTKKSYFDVVISNPPDQEEITNKTKKKRADIPLVSFLVLKLYQLLLCYDITNDVSRYRIRLYYCFQQRRLRLCLFLDCQ